MLLSTRGDPRSTRRHGSTGEDRSTHAPCIHLPWHLPWRRKGPLELQVHRSSTRNGIYDVEFIARAENDRTLGRRPCAQFGNLRGGVAFCHSSDNFERALIDEYPFIVG